MTDDDVLKVLSGLGVLAFLAMLLVSDYMGDIALRECRTEALARCVCGDSCGEIVRDVCPP